MASSPPTLGPHSVSAVGQHFLTDPRCRDHAWDADAYTLRRDPTNAFDPQCVAVYAQVGEEQLRVANLCRDDAAVVAAVMDAGRRVLIRGPIERSASRRTTKFEAVEDDGSGDPWKLPLKANSVSAKTNVTQFDQKQYPTSQATMSVTTTDIDASAIAWGPIVDKGVCLLRFPKSDVACQLPPSTLVFDVDPKSKFATKLKARVHDIGLLAWLRALDANARKALKDQLERYPYKPCLQTSSWGSQVEVKVLDDPSIMVVDEDGMHKGSFQDLQRGARVSVKASGFAIALYNNNGGGSKVCINTKKIWVLPDKEQCDAEEEDEDEECAFAPPRKRAKTSSA